MEEERTATAIGAPVREGKLADGTEVKIGRPPVVLQSQSFGFVVLERPEQLKQWEADLRAFYGIRLDGDLLRGRACETCSCGCTDDCGVL